MDDDKIFFADEAPAPEAETLPRWKILVADDEQAVHLVTRLALGEFTFQNRKVDLLSAYGEEDTKALIRQHPDTALVLLDVVMDTVTSGFDLVRYIREDLQNREVRIILRTGQSGNAPEDEVIINYDINDFKDKTELTVSKLRTTLISSLRAYSHLKIIEEEQKKLAQSKSYLRQIINSLSSLVITLDPQFRINLWNLEAERWSGIPQEAAVGRVLWEVYPPFEPFHEVIKTAFQSWKTFEQTGIPFGPEGKQIIHLSLVPLESGESREMILRVEDTTDLRRKEDLLSRSQRLNALSALSAGLASQMGDLISQVLQESQILSQTPQIPEKFPEVVPHLQTMQSAGLGAMDLLTRIVSLTNRPQGQRKVFSLNTLTQKTIEGFRVPPGVQVQWKSPTQDHFIFGSENDLQEVLQNLLTNSLHACTIQHRPGDPQEGTIEVSLESVVLSPELRSRHPDMEDRGFLLLKVQDTGVGMPAEILARVFDPYFTTKSRQDGMGLGLSMVHNIVELHNGFIEIESSKGEGTLVKVYFPEESAPAKAQPHLQQVLTEYQGSGTILVCDDEAMMRQVASRILDRLGFRVLLAADGPTALEIFQDEKDSIRLVILDMLMPGANGLDIYRQMKNLDPEVKVLISSGFGRGDRVEQALNEGVKGFLQKPFGLESLAQSVFSALESRT